MFANRCSTCVRRMGHWAALADWLRTCYLEFQDLATTVLNRATPSRPWPFGSEGCGQPPVAGSLLRYRPGMDQRPIGIFDSGVGGLTVARAIIDLLPYESVIYFGDTWSNRGVGLRVTSGFSAE